MAIVRITYMEPSTPSINGDFGGYIDVGEKKSQKNYERILSAPHFFKIESIVISAFFTLLVKLKLYVFENNIQSKPY
jgi:hypothetical protein